MTNAIEINRQRLRFSDTFSLDFCETRSLGEFTKLLDDRHDIFTSVCADFESELLGFDGDDDHMHLLVTIHRTLWSPSYFAGSCGGAPIELLRQYIEHQKTPH